MVAFAIHELKLYTKVWVSNPAVVAWFVYLSGIPFSEYRFERTVDRIPLKYAVLIVQGGGGTPCRNSHCRMPGSFLRGPLNDCQTMGHLKKDDHIMTEALGVPTSHKGEEGYSTWKLPSEAQKAICNMCKI